MACKIHIVRGILKNNARKLGAIHKEKIKGGKVKAEIIIAYQKTLNAGKCTQK